MDRIDKFLRKLSRSMRIRIDVAISMILAGQDEKLDIQQLKGFPDCFRCRVGDVRIIYRKYPGGQYGLIEIGFRKEVYHKLKRLTI